METINGNTCIENDEAQARKYGWTDFQDSEDAKLLVVANDNRNVHFTGPQAWAEALAYDKANGYALTDAQALDAIVQRMSGAEWTIHDLAAIADFVRATGRVLLDIGQVVEPGENADPRIALEAARIRGSSF